MGREREGGMKGVGEKSRFLRRVGLIFRFSWPLFLGGFFFSIPVPISWDFGFYSSKFRAFSQTQDQLQLATDVLLFSCSVDAVQQLTWAPISF